MMFLTPAKDRTGIGKITSDWGVLDLFQVADGFILALKNFCRDGKSHHGDFARGDANFSVYVSFVTVRISQS